MLHGVFLDGALVHLEATAGRLVRCGDHAHNLIAAFDEGVQRAHGEFRGAHIDNACISEHTEKFAFEFAEPGFHQVHIEDAGILDGFDGEPGAYRRKDKGRYEFAHERRRTAVVGQAFARDIHHPVQDEEQHGKDGRRAQTAFFDDGTDRSADEKQQQTGQRLRILFPDFYVGAVNQVGIVGRIHDLAVGQVLVLTGYAGGTFQTAQAGILVVPVIFAARRHHGRRLAAPGRVQLFLVGEVVLPEEFVHMPACTYIHQVGQGVVAVAEVAEVHGTHLLAVTGAVGMMEGVVFQGNHHFLVVETDALQRQGGVAVLALVLFLVVHPVKELERQVVLGLGHFDDAAVGYGNARVAFPDGVVVHLDVVHHACLLVPALHPQDVPVDAVVERARGDFDFTFGTADVVAHGVNLVDGVGDQAVAHEESAHADEHAHEDHRQQYARERNAGGLDGGELELLAHVAQRHHGAEQGGQRNGHGQRLAAAPHEEFQDNLEFQALTYQFVNIQPQELHDQYERHNPQDRQERSHKGFE